MNVAAYIPGVLKVALTMVKILNCDYFHFRSLFSFATAGDTVVTIALVSIICCVIGVCWL
jgi:hypothetical protein